MIIFFLFLLFASIPLIIFLINSTNDDKEAEVLNEEIETLKTLFDEAGLEEPTIDNIRKLEEQCRQNVREALEKIELQNTSFVYTNSTFGLCAYEHNCLIKSAKFISMSKEAYMREFDPYLFSLDMNNTSFDKSFEKVFKYLNNRMQYINFEAGEIDRLIRHFRCIKECALNPVQITAERTFKKKDIAYYKLEGASHYISEISGGGTNLAGAVYGGILAGGAGAIVGSQVGTAIKTDVVKKDDRRLFLYYYIGDTLSSEEIITNNIDQMIELFREWIPDKEYTYVVANSNMNAIRSQCNVLPYSDTPKLEEQVTPPKRSYGELKELKELLDLGIITQEEFDRKKREILG